MDSSEMHTALEGPFLSLASTDLEALAEMIRIFLAAMRQKPLPKSASDIALCQAAFDRLELLQQRLTSLEMAQALALRLEDLQSLEGALMLFSIFLCLEVPPSEKRATTLEALWQMREQLARLRRDRYHLN